MQMYFFIVVLLFSEPVGIMMHMAGYFLQSVVFIDYGRRKSSREHRAVPLVVKVYLLGENGVEGSHEPGDGDVTRLHYQVIMIVLKGKLYELIGSFLQEQVELIVKNFIQFIIIIGKEIDSRGGLGTDLVKCSGHDYSGFCAHGHILW